MKISFECDPDLLGVFPEPVRASKAIPNYFRNIKPQIEDNDPQSGTVKRCIPFLDAMTSGFIIPLWSDVYVFANKGELKIDFPKAFPLEESVGFHGFQQIKGHPLENTTYGKLPMKWINPWVIETEPGVSCLFTSPMNHLETRFKVLDGVVDTDTYYTNINFPFLWTGGDGEFLIKKGTPLIQVIPFRRESSDFEVKGLDQGKIKKVNSILGTRLNNKYKNDFWNKKKNSIEEDDVDNDSCRDTSVSVSGTESHISVDTVIESKIENITASVEELQKSDRFESKISSGIIEVTANDSGRGFGEGSF